MVTPTNAQGGPADETAVLPRVRVEDVARRSGRSGASDAEVTTELPKPSVPGAAEETAVLPAVPPGAADETAVLSRGAGGRTGLRGAGAAGVLPRRASGGRPRGRRRLRRPHA
ncbi:integral membrane protein with kinase activity [Streptomyces griseoflavus Tu4000]|uniref:Integral membrane protein with kinase activity n=1 Tax=Streptomyces griseoflavus Tu4000 TaxID=467200 RepID=D9Y1F5_9ACTN|nr:integral membrane protein with kinase activity [Streptomyces griseoflavus Tu4000]